MIVQERMTFRYHFRPVGQGLFSHGRLTNLHRQRFDWVYDCGTDSKAEYLNREVEHFRGEISSSNRIGLLILSHFDDDHVNGVTQLMNGTRVEYLFLPYLTLAERLELAVTD